MNNCAVRIGADDYDPPTFYDEKEVTARKLHKCCECHRPITPGTRYQKASGKWDGDFHSYYTCLDCWNIREGLRCESGFLFGQLWEQITENFAELKSTACLTKISTASAKAYFLERWRKWKGLTA
jgi:hypothetical protein